jgi:hypothetical protein
VQARRRRDLATFLVLERGHRRARAYDRVVETTDRKPPQDYGCTRCFGDDAGAAFDAMIATRVRSLVQESHHGVQITACTCGQRFVMVFTERIDWEGGEDPQDWLMLPIDEAEASRLSACEEAELPGVLAELGRARRFLVRTFPSHESIRAWWSMGGFAIGPHD